MPRKCEDCKWMVMGPYSKLYHGCPIGCDYRQKGQSYDETWCHYEKKQSKEGTDEETNQVLL